MGNNAFAYCNNCPILYYDPSGKALDTIWDAFTLALSIVEVINDPSNPEAWIGLALDAVDLIPFLTGTGEVYRAYRVADRLAEGFGNLTKAKEYGIMGYNALKKVLKGTGLEAHHIIEQRLVKHLGIDISNMLSVAVTKSEHQVFTNAWRKAFAYGMDYNTLTVDAIWDVAQEIYKDYPEILEAAEKILFG